MMSEVCKAVFAQGLGHWQLSIIGGYYYSILIINYYYRPFSKREGSGEAGLWKAEDDNRSPDAGVLF